MRPAGPRQGFQAWSFAEPDYEKTRNSLQVRSGEQLQTDLAIIGLREADHASRFFYAGAWSPLPKFLPNEFPNVDFDKPCRELHGLSLEDHLKECVHLAANGYLPAAIGVAVVENPQQSLAGSLWYKVNAHRATADSTPLSAELHWKPPPFDGRVGQLLVHNPYPRDVRVIVWHPNSGDQFGTYTLNPTERRYISAPDNSRINVGSDWGIQLDDTEIVPVGRSPYVKSAEANYQFEVELGQELKTAEGPPPNISRVALDSRQPSSITFNQRVFLDEVRGSWTVDAAKPRVPATTGHNDPQLEQWSAYKLDTRYPFGVIMVRSDGRQWSRLELGTVLEPGTYMFQINDTALGDNEGSVQLDFYPRK